MAMPSPERALIVAAAAAEAAVRGLDRERVAFLDVLDNLARIW
jgi:hypothetical protein